MTFTESTRDDDPPERHRETVREVERRHAVEQLMRRTWPRGGDSLESCRALWAVCVQYALMEAGRVPTDELPPLVESGTVPQRKLARKLRAATVEARRWIWSEDEGPYTVRWCCELLRLRVQWVRDEAGGVR